MDDVIGKLLQDNNMPDTPTARAIYKKMLEPDGDAPLTMNGVALYPRRQWAGLTDEEIKAAWSQLWCDINKLKFAPDDRPQKETVGFIFAKAIEAKLKERNT